MSPRRTNDGRRRRLSRADRLTPDMQSIIMHLEAFLDQQDHQGRVVCAAKCGVYAFYDYDGEPIYVGQTYEELRVRIRRHLTNQRTDAVAMHVLDPMEVARVEVWPLWDIEAANTQEKRRVLDAAEYAIYHRLTLEARVSKLLNEKAPVPAQPLELPESHAADIIPAGIRGRLGHPDERIARRASTIANLAQVIRERDVSPGLRQTLVTQAERLEHLARRRLDSVTGETPLGEVVPQMRGSGEENED